MRNVMKNLTTQQILDAEFSISEKSPVLCPFDGGFVVADPSLLTPDKCHDKKWHMFFHTTFGVYHAESEDGIDFSKREKILNSLWSFVGVKLRGHNAIVAYVNFNDGI